ncbi:MAG: glycosyltransferase [Desulfobacteraceae bacterium]|nr:MAG: glycosyltransferase [Desulfobacteraceae bacterium]
MVPSISVIVCTNGRPSELSTCLKALLKQQYAPLEIVVIDILPEDAGTQVLMRNRFPMCRYVSGSELGSAGARNLGILETSGEIIAFLDEGSRPLTGWSRAIVKSFAENQDLGCCTGPVLPEELKTRAQKLFEARGGFSRGFGRVVLGKSNLIPSGGYPLNHWKFGASSNVAFRRSTLIRIGGFDTSISVKEDLDIFFRILKANYWLVYEPKSIVFHQYPRTYKELRRTLHLLGHGYIGALLKIADSDPLYRRNALSEVLSWFLIVQLKDRLWGGSAGKGRRFPAGLVLAEITGGARAMIEHMLHRSRRRKEELLVLPGFFSPFIRLLRRWT